MKLFGHLIAVLILTVLTQIGGIVWLLNYGTFNLLKFNKPEIFKFLSFVLFYLIMSFLIIPPLAKSLGRVALPITKSGNLIPHNFITPLLNRHYVKPSLRTELLEISESINSKNPKLKVSYLDANFPFIDGFPLLPHLSHNDGRKIDLTFFYTQDKKEGNLKPSNLGYGKFVEPLPNEINQTEICKSKGYWQYDYSKYLTLGSRNDLEFDLSNTKTLVHKILNSTKTDKLLIEPHLKNRLNLNNDKIRFQGCHSVRHDDHIHYQIKNDER
jgi:hypothetical protein